MAKVSLEKDKIKFLLVEGVHQKALESLRAAGYTNIEFHKGALDTEQLKESIRDAHFIGLRSRTHLTEDVIDAAEKLVAIGCFCIGTNQVDLTAAAKRGIPVFNAPFSNTRSVAELVIGELLLLLRGVPEANAKAHRGVWNKLATGSFEARGKKLGIIGYGHIGTQLGILAESLGMRVFYYDIESKLPLGNAQPIATLEELLNTSDVVTLHVPETLNTKELIAAMKAEKTATSSSCPSPEDFAAELRKNKESHVITMTSGLSGTYNSARVARNMVLEEDDSLKLASLTPTPPHR